MRRLVYLGVLVTLAVGLVLAIALDWSRVVGFLNGAWPQWVSNVANVLQIVAPAAALAWWLTRAARARTTVSCEGAVTRFLRLLALLLPAPDRDRFVGEVVSGESRT